LQTLNLTEAYLPEKGIFVCQKPSFSGYGLDIFHFGEAIFTWLTLKGKALGLFGSLSSFVKDEIPASFYKTTEASATKPNVRVRVGRGIVQVERKDAIIRAIVPVAAADEAALLLNTIPSVSLSRNRIKVIKKTAFILSPLMCRRLKIFIEFSAPTAK